MHHAVKPLTPSEKVSIAIAMTWAAGFVDIVGYISLYGLYTSHMTGNTVAMARHIADMQWIGVVRSGWPILAFVTGLLLGAFIYEAEKRRRIRVPFPLVIGLETLMLAIFIAAGIGSGYRPDIPPQPAGKFFVMVALLATSMGMQNVAIKKVSGVNVYTTFVTGSLVKFAEGLSEYLFWLYDRTRHRCWHRIILVFRISLHMQSFQRAALTLSLWTAYLGGAVCGGFSIKWWALLGMAGPTGLLFTIAVYGAFRPFLPLSSDEW
ncbi:MAG: DUF1275 domain-containing protein [Deltaproteobacteria bacterium]|nr:DUF1275 domain-containing protein [Deltaproteobacteria bacterium]